MEDHGAAIVDDTTRKHNDQRKCDNEAELGPGVEQLFSLSQKVKLFPVEVIQVLQPNLFVIRWLTSNDGEAEESEAVKEFKLVENYHRLKGDFGKDIERFKVNENVVVRLEDVRADDEEDHQFFRGTIASKLFSTLYSVFLFDLGTIRNVSCFEMAKLDGNLLPTFRYPIYSLVTIPGIVPRKRLDFIPGLSDANIADIRWNSQVLEDVRTWLSMHQGRIALQEIQGECGGFSSLLYGDLYCTGDENSEAGGHLSSYLIKCKNVFMNHKLLNQVFPL